MSTFFIVDNRKIIRQNSDTFEVEAYTENYNRNVFNLLASYHVLSQRNISWLPPITGVAVATSLMTSHLLPASKCDIPTLKNTITIRQGPAFNSTQEASKQQWGYFNDALRKIMNEVPADIESFDGGGGGAPLLGSRYQGVRPATATTATDMGIITIITTDQICEEDTDRSNSNCKSNSVNPLLTSAGYSHTHSNYSYSSNSAGGSKEESTNHQSAFDMFCGLIKTLIVSGFRVRLLCIQMASSASGTTGTTIAQIEKTRRLQCLFLSIKRVLQYYDPLPAATTNTINNAVSASSSLDPATLKAYVEQHFSTAIIENSPLYFEEETKLVLQHHMKPLVNCVLKFGAHQSHQEEGISSSDMEVTMTVSLVITPISCDGATAMHPGLKTPVCFQQVPRTQLHPMCIKGNALIVTPCTLRSQHNRIGYCALSRYLAERQLLLVVKVHHAESSSEQFWCLIPPEINSHHRQQLSSVPNGLTEDPLLLYDKPMFLLQLQDSEGIVNYTAITTTDANTTGTLGTTTSSSNTTSSNSSAIANEETRELLQFMEDTISSSLNSNNSNNTDTGAAHDHGPGSRINSSFYNPLFAVSHSLQSAVEEQSVNNIASTTATTTSSNYNRSVRTVAASSIYGSSNSNSSSSSGCSNGNGNGKGCGWGKQQYPPPSVQRTQAQAQTQQSYHPQPPPPLPQQQQHHHHHQQQQRQSPPRPLVQTNKRPKSSASDDIPYDESISRDNTNTSSSSNTISKTPRKRQATGSVVAAVSVPLSGPQRQQESMYGYPVRPYKPQKPLPQPGPQPAISIGRNQPQQQQKPLRQGQAYTKAPLIMAKMGRETPTTTATITTTNASSSSSNEHSDVEEEDAIYEE